MRGRIRDMRRICASVSPMSLIEAEPAGRPAANRLNWGHVGSNHGLFDLESNRSASELYPLVRADGYEPPTSSFPVLCNWSYARRIMDSYASS